MRVDVIMPQMGESIAEGTLTRWLKKPGDKVARDEPIFEISTDKVDAEIPSPAAGTLVDIKVQEGHHIQDSHPTIEGLVPSRLFIERIERLRILIQSNGAALLLDGHPELVARGQADGTHLTGIAAFKAAAPGLKPKYIAGCGGLATRPAARLFTAPSTARTSAPPAASWR